MYLHTYRAATMREALELVRRELGGDAVILSTRHVRLRGRLPWQTARHEAEVVAGLVGGTAGPTRESESRPSAAESRAALRSAAGRDLRETGLRNAPTGLDVGLDLRDARVAGGRGVHRDPTETPRGTAAGDAAGPSETLETLVSELRRAARGRAGDEVPDELFHLYTRLIDADVSDDDARELLMELRRDCAADLDGPARARSVLAGHLRNALLCRGAIQVPPGRRMVAALVGPTGVGKTTTIAKLAASFKLRERLRVGLVTVDTYRVAAVEQLRTYADIMDLPMLVATSPREIRRALDELRDADLVLIDTAGRSPRDELKIQELKGFLAEAHADEVHLVLSVASSFRALQQTAERFRSLGPTAVLLTKLDEAPGLGALYSAARRLRLPFSYFTTGQDVPDDIEPADSDRAVRLILGEEDLYRSGSQGCA